MADQSQKTEQPTKRRLDNARKEGRFPVSREFVSALQFLGFVWLLSKWGGQFFSRLLDFMRVMLAESFRIEPSKASLTELYSRSLMQIILPLTLAGAGLSAMMLVAQLGSTNFGIAPQKLSPDFSRLNPAQRLMDFPKQGLSSLGQAVLLLPVLGYAVYRIAADNLDSYLTLPRLPLPTALRLTADSYFALLWKAAFVLLLIGALDLFRQRSRIADSLRMTKQEVKEESKEMEGNPQIKQKIRKIQRDMARRSMMKEVPKATAVIVNPTHYSVAILYRMESMAAPKVVAKGKNLIALRIREIALQNQVPIVENQPLAQALYKSADVGQEIPPHLYRAVAEILAYLFKLMNQRGV